VWVTPCERLKTLRQTQLGVAAASERHTSMVVSTRLLLREQGLFAGLFAGAGPTVIRQAGSVGVRFALYDAVMHALHSVVAPQAWHALVCGFVVGVVTTVLNNPVDVVKSRVQAYEPALIRPTSATAGTSTTAGISTSRPNNTALRGASHTPRRMSGMAAAREVLREQGLRGFTAGLQPRLLKIGVGQAVIFYSYEQITLAVNQQSQVADTEEAYV
jgi:hypothetical protein